jgi:hypothetical protein
MHMTYNHIQNKVHIKYNQIQNKDNVYTQTRIKRHSVCVYINHSVPCSTMRHNRIHTTTHTHTNPHRRNIIDPKHRTIELCGGNTLYTVNYSVSTEFGVIDVHAPCYQTLLGYTDYRQAVTADLITGVQVRKLLLVHIYKRWDMLGNSQTKKKKVRR